MWMFLALYSAFMNGAGFIMMAEDKSAARNHRKRIAEKSILTIALLGGFLGVYVGMKHYRHKTRKTGFQAYLLSIFILYVLAGLVVLVLWP